MAAQPGVTLTFAVPDPMSTPLSTGLTDRRYVLIVNNPFLADGLTPNTNWIAVSFGTNNNASINGIPIPPGGSYELDTQRVAATIPATDIAVVALTVNGGMPQVSFMEF